MKITWVTRSFLDYRIPVYKEINRLCGNQLTVIYYADVVPQRCQDKLKKVLGGRAIGLSGEIRIGGRKTENQAFANTGGLRIPLRPGLIRIVKKSQPDIIISDGFFQWSYSALINNALWKTPHVMCYERTLHTERNVSNTRTIARKLAIRYISAICCNGIKTKEYLMNLGVSESKLCIGNMAADTKGLQEVIAKISSIEIDKFKNKHNIQGTIFLYVGQIIHRKGIMELLSAWEQFFEINKESSLILLGNGEQFEEVESYITKQQLKNVYLLGKVDYTEVAKFYAAADIFIISTLEDNWSLVVPEAMSCNLPIICSKYNGCWTELVREENGWVFDPLNHNNFVQTLDLAWKNRLKWEKMGKNSLNIVKHFTPEKIALNIYRKCHELTKN